MELGDLLRFTHCGKTVFTLADAAGMWCPVCGQKVRFALSDAPVRIRSPIRDGHHASCCFLVTSQGGTASLSDFEGTSDLHTGISSTSGVVYNYTERGVSRDVSGWQHCVSIPLVRPDRFHLLAQWDQYLDRFSDVPLWDPTWHSFDEDNHNCFSFCLQFINSVLSVEGRPPLTRETFTRTFILPRMARVSKYMTLCRHIEKEYFYVVNRQAEGQDEA
ncbi:MKRN2 opposite strand protein-like isoform X2 [Nerophis lumbriciformis]|uniref:MKRN2 opposite strand protein-like isoform X2 n=1 Tax=Nerophis lumbriciformis TaxID=546530 RepID=UPI002ADF52EB|nr:MKRN2 opposite strand protein-like isoform X2 [Nerophis lumbriciformis]